MWRDRASALAARSALTAHLVHRGYTGRHRLLALLAGLSIAASVALAVSLEIASRGVQAQVERTRASLAGSADLEVRAGTAPIPEALLERVRTTEGVDAADPVTYERFRIIEGAHAGAPLHVVGVDFLAERPVHQYAFESGQLEAPDPLQLVGANALIVTGAFRDRMGVALGDEIRVRGPQRELTLAVRGFLSNSGLGRAFGSQVAVMDVYTLQALKGRQGYLDAITVDVAPTADASGVRARLEEAVQGVASVVTSGTSGSGLGRSLDLIRLGVGAMVAVGMGVAGMLAYGTASLSAQRRTREFALLRIGGLEARRVRAVVTWDGLLIGAFGTLAGVPAGVALAGVTTRAFTGMTAFFGESEMAQAEPTGWTLAVGLAVGLPMSVLGAAIPAWQAGRRQPLAVLDATHTIRARCAPWVRRALPVAIVLLAAAVVAPLPALAQLGVVAALGVAGIHVAVRAHVGAWSRWAAGGLSRLLPGVGFLFGTAASARPAQAALVVAAIAALLGAIGAFSITISTVARTVDAWVRGEGELGAILEPANPLTMNSESILPEAIVRVRGIAGVKDVAEIRHIEIRYGGSEMIVWAADAATTSRYDPHRTIDGRDPTDGLIAGGVLLSDTFARRLGPTGARVVDAGWIALDTPHGSQRFPIAGVVRDYNPAPVVIFDLATFRRHWPTTQPKRLHVWTEEPSQPVLDAIVAAVEDVQPLYALNSEALARWGSEVAAGFRGLLDAVSALVATLGGVAVLGLLAGSVAERRRELALLHAAGVARRQLGVALALDAFAVALVGVAFGCVLALLLGGPMIRIVEATYGWSLVRVTPWDEVGVQALCFLAIATAAGVPPARAATRATGPEALAAD